MPLDGTFGTKGNDGTWTGMLGLVSREEADIAVGPFSLTFTRSEAVDFTWPLYYDNTKILAGLGRPEVNPWGFLLPLAPLVWTFILIALLLLPALMVMCSSYLFPKTHTLYVWLTDAYEFIRVLLQECISIPSDWWWWQRVVLAVWMLMTLVLTRSYAGNLMSLLAVRHIPQPFQSLREVIDDPSTIMIWQKNSINAEYLRTVKSGIIREVADLEAEERVMYSTHKEYKKVVNTLIRNGRHVLVDVYINLRNLMAEDFTTSESGLFMQWFRTNIPNSTTCLSPPKKITVRTSLSLANLWGMFVVLAGGCGLSLLVLCVEMRCSRIL
ncbi:probable glutamate receptor [Homarus americanus]|uniref:probable glutamate receptor n=1 Tax=Homarus americanus TaxID=6706 RepID=UPI001C4459E0|nr:probable glutamate receptor [Homarus americanus]